MKTPKAVSLLVLTVILAGPTICIAGADVPALKDVFKKDFLIGAALGDDVVSGKDPNAAQITPVRKPVDASAYAPLTTPNIFNLGEPIDNTGTIISSKDDFGGQQPIEKPVEKQANNYYNKGFRR